jgi:4-amino-4-deoxy-L-arabinose transferase-like glycosyltransferase
MRPAQAVGLLSLALLAIALVLESGKRGFLAADQSIVFDGGYRVFLGQVPYRDFFIPTGPMVFWLQGAFFHIFGVTYRTYILHAALVNAAASLLAFWWVRTIYPGAFAHAFLAAVLTAFWFYPPFGTPWFEQTAFFFHFCSMVLLVRALADGDPDWREPLLTQRGYWMLAAAGFAACLSFLSKQNAGLLAVAAGLGVLWLGTTGGLRRRLLGSTVFLGGAALAGLLFGAWLALESNADWFRLFFFEVPAAEGWRRLGQRTAEEIVLGAFSLATPVRTACSLSGVVGFGVILSDAYQRVSGGKTFLNPQRRMAATTLLSLFVLQSLFLRVTINEPENGFAFAGMIVVLALLLVRGFILDTPLGDARAALRTIYWLGSLLLCVAVLDQGRTVALSRQVHDVFWRSRFDRSVVSQALAPVVWAVPTPAARRSSEEIRVQDVDGLVDFLRGAEGDFFVFPDYTVLYGVTGRTPPQPLLWFDPGLTYPRDPPAWLDRRLVEALRNERVQHVILERESLAGTQNRLAHFPGVRRYVRSGFEPVREFGLFHVLRRKTSGREDRSARVSEGHESAEPGLSP